MNSTLLRQYPIDTFPDPMAPHKVNRPLTPYWGINSLVISKEDDPAISLALSGLGIERLPRKEGPEQVFSDGTPLTDDMIRVGWHTPVHVADIDRQSTIQAGVASLTDVARENLQDRSDLDRNYTRFTEAATAILQTLQ